jgi:SAM-dependent methyltransferase
VNQMTVPNEAIKYILFQRTAYQHFPNTFTYRVLKRILPFSIYNQAVEREARVDSSRIKALYEDDMRREYQSIKEFLPKTCNSILDIGCGVAGIDVFLSKHFKDIHPTFYLLDKTSIEKVVFYDFKHKASFYNSLDVAKEMLIRNGIPKECVHLIEATDNNDINIGSKVELVISLISWGFHYPVETYLDKVHDLLIKGGSLIIDVRKGTADIDILRNVFSKVDVIFDERKFQRVFASK